MTGGDLSNSKNGNISPGDVIIPDIGVVGGGGLNGGGESDSLLKNLNSNILQYIILVHDVNCSVVILLDETFVCSLIVKVI